MSGIVALICIIVSFALFFAILRAFFSIIWNSIKILAYIIIAIAIIALIVMLIA